MKSTITQSLTNLFQGKDCQRLKRLRHLHYLIWLTLLPAMLLDDDVLIGALVLSGLLLVVVIGHQKYVRDLEAHIKSGDGPTWQVAVNGVKAGTIEDVEYRRILQAVVTDSRVYRAQAANVIRVFFRTLDYLYSAIPLALFWIGISLAIFAPETFDSLLTSVRAASPSSVREAMSSAGNLVLVVMFFVLAMHWILGLSRFGFVNKFNEAVNYKVRNHCGVPAEGEITLWSVDSECSAVAEATDMTHARS